MIKVRAAVEADAAEIREIFIATYGEDYIYPRFYEERYLRKLIHSDDTLMLVAEDLEKGSVIGTASVVLESGAYTDLVGEFGRLAVHPKAWGRGIGAMLLEERIKRVEDRLHVGFMEARVTHPYALTNGLDHGFAPVGFLPQKLRFGDYRENTVLLVRYFQNAIELRRNHPRIVPEAYQLADAAMEQVRLEPDFVVDDSTATYPHGEGYAIEEFSDKGYSSLLRIERGRLSDREIFGPLRLHYGLFKIRAESSTYLVAKRDGHIVGAVGFTHDVDECILRVFELIFLEDEAVRFLLDELETRSRRDYQAVYIEIDVSAYAPRMQRTLLELGYVPASYVPALAFHRVERLDVVKMARLLIPLNLGPMALVSPAKEIADLVLRGFERQEILPRFGEVVDKVGIFSGLTDEQQQRLGGVFRHVSFEIGERIFSSGDPCEETYVLLEGEVAVEIPGGSEPVGVVGVGECLGEVALLTGTRHSADAVVTRPVKAAQLGRSTLSDLVRQRPDIGVVLYRNLAKGLGEKLRRTDLAWVGSEH